MEIVAGTFVNEPELRQEFPVKPSCDFHVFHSQINMIKASRFHFVTFMWFAARFNRVPVRRIRLATGRVRPTGGQDA
jgi:hypothetical protein